MTEEIKELSELEIRLGESDGFRRSQVLALSDALAAANGEMAVLRSQLAKPDLAARVAELETIVSEKDAQIVEQSNSIVALRARVDAL